MNDVEVLVTFQQLYEMKEYLSERDKDDPLDSCKNSRHNKDILKKVD